MEFKKIKPANRIFDLTPLIDVVFLLIIFFLLSSSFVLQPGIKVKLPASQISELRPQSGIFIVISEQEKIYLQDKEVDIEGLEKGLKAQLEEEARPVVIRADKNVRHGKVVEVMDVVKLSGAERLLIATSPRVVDEKDLLE